MNTKAAGRAAAELANSLDGIPPRDTTSVNPSSKRGVARNFTKWLNVARGADKHHSCSGDTKSVI